MERGPSARELRPEIDREAVEVALAPDEADLGLERHGVDEIREGDVAEIELAGDADHVAVEPLLGEGVVRAEAELAAEHHVERVRRRAARLVAELHPRELLGLARALLV